MANRTRTLNKFVHLRISNSLYEDLTDLAVRTNRTESSLAREAIAAFVQHYIQNPDKIARGKYE